MGAVPISHGFIEEVTTYIAFIIAGLIFLLILFTVFFNMASKKKWKKYNQIDQRILHRHGKRYVGKFHSATIVPGTDENTKDRKPKEYDVLIEYQAEDGKIYRARPATFCEKIYAHRLKRLKSKKKIPILAYKTLCYFDLDLDGSDGEGPIYMITPKDYLREYKKAFLIMPPPKHHPSEFDEDLKV